MLAFLEGPELIIVLVIVLLVFGGSQLPKLARSLGQMKGHRCFSVPASVPCSRDAGGCMASGFADGSGGIKRSGTARV